MFKTSIYLEIYFPINLTTSRLVDCCRRFAMLRMFSFLWITLEIKKPFILQALLNYISGLNIPGAVLIFLPGWNLIFALHKHLKMHPQFGKNNQYPISSYLKSYFVRQTVQRWPTFNNLRNQFGWERCFEEFVTENLLRSIKHSSFFHSEHPHSKW